MCFVAQPKMPMMQPNSMHHPLFPPPLMAQKIDVPMQGPSIPYNHGPPRQMMMGPPVSYSNVVADRNKILPKGPQYRGIENNVDIRRRPPKTNSPARSQLVENSNVTGGVEEEKMNVSFLP